MPRFFVTEPFCDTVTIGGEDARHISRSLRMAVGEKLTVCDTRGTDFLCEIASVSDKEVFLNVLSKSECTAEPSVKLTLYQAMPKSDKLELIVQKAVELGADAIVPVMTSRCISRPDKKSMDNKLDRLNKIALSAAQQSGRGIIPQVLPVMNFSDAVKKMREDDCAILFYESRGKTLKSLLSTELKSVSIRVGSEGGFEADEVAFAENEGVNIVNLGPRILRCETAPMCAISAVMYATGNLE